jgi:hypothetical protein
MCMYEDNIEGFVKPLQKQLPVLESKLMQQMHANSSKLLELGQEVSQDPSECQTQFAMVFQLFWFMKKYEFPKA